MARSRYKPGGGSSYSPPRRSGGGGRPRRGPGYATPPPGTFDPGLEAQRRQSRRGLADQRFDTARAERLAGVDLETELALQRRDKRRALGELLRGKQRGVQDLSEDLGEGLQDIGLARGEMERDYAREVEDIALAQGRGTEDFNRAVAALDRRYATQGDVQTQAAAAAGVTRGGFAEQSAAKRASNQEFDRAPIDTANTRLTENLATRRTRGAQDRESALAALGLSEGRLREDVGQSRQRLGQDFRTARKDTKQDARTNKQLTKLDARRASRDRTLDLSRDIREQGFFEIDTTQQEYFAASQADPTIQFPTLAQIRRRARPRRQR